MGPGVPFQPAQGHWSCCSDAVGGWSSSSLSCLLDGPLGWAETPSQQDCVVFLVCNYWINCPGWGFTVCVRAVHGGFCYEIWMSFTPFLFFCRKKENHPTSYTSTIFFQEMLTNSFSYTIFLFILPPIHLSLPILIQNKQIDIQSKQKCKTNKKGSGLRVTATIWE